MVPNFLTARSTANVSYTHFSKGALIQLGSLLQPHKHNASLFASNSFNSATTRKGDSFTVSYLIHSCGVSPTMAAKLSNMVHLKNPNASNAVLDLLKAYGFSQTHLAKFVEKHPNVLVANAENTLLPKLQFFRSIGFSNTDLPKVLISNRVLLMSSLKNCLIPRYEILRSVVRDNEEVVRALKTTPRSFTYCDIMNDLVPNIEFLRRTGVPQASISLLIIHFPSAAYMKHSKFVEGVEAVKKIGFEPLKTSFVMAVQVILKMSKETWESRFEMYNRWGWSREMVLHAFRNFPYFLKLSEEMVTKKMSFLLKDMGVSTEKVATTPLVLAYNLETRIIPRFSVIKILSSKGLLKNNLQFGSFMRLSEEVFTRKYVIPFQEALPRLPDVYKGLVDYKSVI